MTVALSGFIPSDSVKNGEVKNKFKLHCSEKFFVDERHMMMYNSNVAVSFAYIGAL